jgi:RsiW-degrading membrane proteinase PrsW (M82 family)
MCGAPAGEAKSAALIAGRATPAYSARGEQYFGAGAGAARAVDQLASVAKKIADLHYGTLLPVRAFWESKAWRAGWTGLFGLAALVPFFLLHLAANSQDIGTLAWGFSLYFAVIWLIAIRMLVRPDAVSWRVLVPVALFTMVAGVTIAITLERSLGASGRGWFENILTVGLPEELSKALAVFVFVFLFNRPLSPKTYLYVGAVSGLAFGVAEAASYSVLYSKLLPEVTSTAPIIGAEIWRLITDSLLHAALTGTACYFIGLAARHRRQAVPLIVLGLVVASVLHGTYDTFAANWLGFVLAALIIFVFVGYVTAGDAISERFAQEDGEAALRRRTAEPTTSTTSQSSGE